MGMMLTDCMPYCKNWEITTTRCNLFSSNSKAWWLFLFSGVDATLGRPVPGHFWAGQLPPDCRVEQSWVARCDCFVPVWIGLPWGVPFSQTIPFLCNGPQVWKKYHRNALKRYKWNWLDWIRLQQWYITIPSSDQWCTTIENHHYQWLSYPKTIGKPLIPMPLMCK